MVAVSSTMVFEFLFSETRHLIVSSPTKMIFRSKTKTIRRFALFKKMLVRLRGALRISIIIKNAKVERI
jgi:hypothetical protein